MEEKNMQDEKKEIDEEYGERGKYGSSSRYFENHACKYYPCHQGTEHINCLFCYCPLYTLEHCPGEPVIREKDVRRIKSCVNCTFPHHPENYEKVTGLAARFCPRDT
jgi:Zn-finger protein